MAMLSKEDFESKTSFLRFVRERLLLHNVTPSSAEWHRQSLRWLRVEEPTRADLNDLVCRMREAGLSASSVNTRIRSVNAYLHWLATYAHAGYVGNDSGVKSGVNSEVKSDGKCGSGCKHLRIARLKEPQNVVSTYTPEQVRLLIQYKPASQNFCQRRLSLLVCTLFDCGLRITEALTLPVSHVDLDNLLLLVTGKGNKQRRVPFSLELRKRIYRFVRDFQLDAHTLLFCTRGHTMLNKDIVRRDVKLLCESLGFASPARTLHAMRHTFGTNYVRKGGDVFRLQKVLGHSSLSTSRIYANLNTEDLSEVHQRLSLLGD
jgi:integrase/recombinase XerD